MSKVKKKFEDSGLSLEALGQQMGYEEGTARRAAWQFLNRTTDPRLSMLMRFADALGVDLKDIV